MSKSLTYEEVEMLAGQLRPWEQLKLVARVSGRLSQALVNSPDMREKEPGDHAVRVQAFLQMSEEYAAECIGEVDAAADIRQIRDERASRL